MLRTQSIMINVAGTNLGMWTNYAGRDPNVETSPYPLGEVYQNGDDGTGVLQPRSWSLSVNLGF